MNLRRTAVRFMLATGRRTAKELAAELGIGLSTVREYSKGLSELHEGYRRITAETQVENGLNLRWFAGDGLPVDAYLRRNS